MQRIIVGVSGASGMPIAFSLLSALNNIKNLEVHLVVSKGAKRVLLSEHQNCSAENIIKPSPKLSSEQNSGLNSDLNPDLNPPQNTSPSSALNAQLSAFEALAAVVYNVNDMGAAIASGSWGNKSSKSDAGACLGMIICPCSMSTVASIASGVGINLLHRAADVTLKERRKLVIVPRETPLSSLHLKNMLELSQMGVTIMPPCFAFYNNVQSINEGIQHFCGRVLDQFDLEHDLCSRWKD